MPQALTGDRLRMDFPTQHLHETSPAAAAVIAPILIAMIEPASVIDVGCGVGSWLEAFPGLSVLGIDEHDPADVSCPYRQHDLRQPFSYGRFDLALCLEVAEHLPAEAAPTLVASLVEAAPVVAFSAAIPGQVGHGHVNCQWPGYWRSLFAEHGYTQYDSIRALVWDDERVAWWYRQNTFLYSSAPLPAQSLPERIVHPGCFEIATRTPGALELVRTLPTAVATSVRKRLGS